MSRDLSQGGLGPAIDRSRYRRTHDRQSVQNSLPGDFAGGLKQMALKLPIARRSCHNPGERGGVRSHPLRPVPGLDSPRRQLSAYFGWNIGEATSCAD
jgi:hypothetical protein